jgi:tRNA (guanosine-2'-O-)-methyltransferase
MKRWADDVFQPAPPAPLRYAPEAIIAALEPVALPERVARIDLAVASRIASVVVVIESLSDPHNAAAILRTCDGLGVHEVDAIERDAHVLITTRVTKGCEKWMDLRRHASPEACASALRARGYKLLVADMRATTVLDEIAEMPRVALAFGNEKDGISRELRAAADGSFAVPMRGMVESFNVSVAAAITLGAVTKNRGGDLGGEEGLTLKARFLMESVREPEMIIERYAHDHGLAPRGE